MRAMGAACLVLLVSGLAAANAVAQAYPDCDWKCTSNDVVITELSVSAPSTCEVGQPLSGELLVTFFNRTGTDRYAVRFLGDLYVNGLYEGSFDECAAETIPPGTSTVLLATVSWTCGHSLEFRDFTVSWTTKRETCGDEPDCTARKSKCSLAPVVPIGGTPPAADFASDSPVCDGEALQFVDATTGGEPSYSYLWDFGDLVGTSASSDPSYLYGEPGTYTVTLSVTDAAGLVSSVSHDVLVSANPVASASNGGAYCPGDTVELFADGGVSYGWTGPSGFSSGEQNPTIPSATPANAGVYTVTVTDVHGCTDRASTLVEMDATAPVLTLPPDTTVECGSSTDAAQTGQATATDDAGASPDVTHSDAVAFDECDGATGSLARTWTATDPCGNSVSADQTITVVDTTDPVLSVPADVTVECDADSSSASTGVATATDNCDPAPAVTESDSVAAGTCPQESVITRTWTATDACGNSVSADQTITVVDTTDPVLSVPADVTVECDADSSSASTGVATATDNCDAAPAVTESDSVAAETCPQESIITRTWTVTDACGNSVSADQTITVVDTTDPVLSVPADVTVECDADSSSASTGVATATDNCDAAPAVTESDSVAAETCPQESIITRTWTATDACGNSVSADQTITVVDTTDPVLSVPADVTVECDADSSSASTGVATATDNCDAAPAVTESDSVAAGTCPQESVITRTWTATDACGNVASEVQTITIVDTTPPSLSVSGAQFECDGAGNVGDISAWLASAVGSDVCSAATVTDDYAGLTGSCQGVGSAEVMFAATDACGNLTQRTATVTIVDTTPPTADDDSATTDEDIAVTIDVLANDGDVCASLLTIIAVGTPTFGAAASAGEQVRFTPPTDFDGTATFSYTVEDCAGNTDTALVEISVLPVNDPPVANDQTATTQEDTPLELTVTATDRDGDAVTYSILSGPSHGTISGFDPATGELTYTPSGNYNGPDGFTFEACDPSGACDTGVVTITVEPIDDPPVANPQAVTTPEDTAVELTVTGSDPDGDAVTYGIVSGPSNGTISGFDPATGELTYTPAEDYTGTDSFVFEVCDPHPEHGCAQATVTITVTPVNDPPVANDQARVTPEDTATGLFSLSIGDPDDALGELACDCLTPPQHGTVERGADHTVNYTPEGDFFGRDTLTYIVCDPDGACDTATVTVEVTNENDNPTVTTEDRTTWEETPVDVPVEHTDPDGDTLTCTVSDPLHGSVDPASGTVSGPYPATGTISYTPDAGYVGVDQFTVTCDDGNGGTDVATVEITVLPVNDPPVANDQTATTQEDTPLELTVTATDRDGDRLTYSILSGPSHGTISGFDPATGELTYTPSGDYNGPDGFTFEACDPSGACDTGVVTITVEPIDDPPVANPQTVTTPEDTAVELTVTGSDPEGDAVTYGIVSGPSHGTISGFDPATGELTYTPAANYAGPDSFVFEVCDPDPAHGCAQATVTITVTPVNDPPVASDQTRVTPEGTATGFFSLSIGDPDDALGELACDCLTPPQHGTVERGADHTVNYTPDGDFFGRDTFTYIVCDPDGACDTATVTVDVLPVNDPPVANDQTATTQEDTPLELTVTATDRDGDAVTYSILSGPSHGTISGFDPATGELTYTPSGNYNGPDGFTFEACDPSGACDTGVVTITVEPIDDPPVANPQAVTTPEDTAVELTVTGSDPDGDAVTYGIVSGPSNGTISGFDPATGELTYTPAEDYTGTDSFVFEVCDPHPEHGCAQATVTITVTPVNDPPVANDQARVTPEDTATGLFSLSIGDPDDALGELACDCLTPPQHGTVERGADHTVNYTPDGDFFGRDTFTYIVCDPDGACDTATVTVEVTNENDNPTVTTEDRTTWEETPVDVPVEHTDPDGDTLTCTVSDPLHGSVDPASGTVSGPYPATGTISYTPDAGYVGVDQFTVTCDDGNGGTDVATVEITVLPVNDPPVANDQTATTQEDTPLELTVTATDRDGDRLTYSILSGPSHGTISGFDPATGELTYTPSGDYNGPDGFTFEACDPSGACDTGVVTITVEPIDDPPVANPQTVTTPEDTAVELTVTGSDPEGDAVTYGIVSGPSHGTISGFDPATGELTYTPAANYAGPDSFVFEVCDPDPAHGCAQATVTITVTPVNDPPVASDQTRVTPEGTATGFFSLAIGDPDDALEELACDCLTPPQHGTVERGADHTVNYTPDGDFFGRDTFTYIVCDPDGACDTATVTVDVLPVNDPPTIGVDSYVTPEDTPIGIGATGSDPDGDTLTFSILSGPNHGEIVDFNPARGTGIYVPDSGYDGADSVLVSVCDSVGGCDVGTIGILVIPENDPPTAACFDTVVTQGVPVALTLRATDPEGDAITFEIVELPHHGRIVEFEGESGDLVYVPDPDYAGPDEIVFRACDSALACDICVVQLFVVRAAGAGGAAGPCEERMLISEIGWSGTRAGEAHEWIELRNLETTPVDLTGWTLRWRRSDAVTGPKRLWKTVSLSGIVGAGESGDDFHFVPNSTQPQTWWLMWDSTPRDDFFLLEAATDDVILLVTADQLYEVAAPFGTLLDLDDFGDVLQLLDPSGCVVDTANAAELSSGGWAAGSTAPPASMERVDPFGLDVVGNWHTNLGLVREGLDGMGNLVHGTPRGANSPVLSSLVKQRGLVPASVESSELVVIRIESRPEWSTTRGLWHVVALNSRSNEPLDVDWSVEDGTPGEIILHVHAVGSPSSEIHVWVRTPSGEVLVAPITVNP